jgi:pimeloyl-ACP methyl ester carboxylesterase
VRKTTVWRIAVVVAVAALAMVGLSVMPVSASAGYPVNWDPASATLAGVVADVPPPGANLPCHPSAAHPYPVVLVHGITQDQNSAWQALAPTLANNGFCVYTVSYGKVWYSLNLGGIDQLANSASEVHTFVDHVLASTGASKIDMVGYSEGGFVSRLYMKNYGAQYVHSFVGISAVNSQPANISGILTIAYLVPAVPVVLALGCPACTALSTWPAFTALNTPSATFPSVDYLDIATSKDEIATPYQLAFLPAAPNVRNMTIQQLCPNDPVGHLGMPYDKTTVRLVLNDLDPADAQPVTCSTGFPL